MFQNKVNQYLRNKNKMLEQALDEYAINDKNMRELVAQLTSLESEWNSEIKKLKEQRAEYDKLIKEVKILRHELLGAKKRKEVSR